MFCTVKRELQFWPWNRISQLFSFPSAALKIKDGKEIPANIANKEKKKKEQTKRNQISLEIQAV